MRDDRWRNLVTGAFYLDDELASVRGRGSVARRRLALEYLDSILEVFSSDLDPVEDFEGYAVRRLAQSLRRALHDAGTPPPARPRARAPRSRAPRSRAPRARLPRARAPRARPPRARGGTR